MEKWLVVVLIDLVFLSAELASGQVVQLPISGSFNLSTSASVPDSGAAALGSASGGRAGVMGRGPLGASSGGSSLGGGSVSVHATIIDLTELDSMIRSQAGKIASEPKLQATPPSQHVHIRTAPRGRDHRAEYEYLAALSRDGIVEETHDRDSVAYYLGMAERARNRGNWSSVELYYRLAWKNLPLARREAALRDLAEARSRGSEERSASTSTKKNP